jgi:glycerophosphoryl diester phosphodiesterase
VTAVIAHRGSTRHHLANTLAAFAEARELGADGVELDVRLGADGSLVVIHDPTLEGGLPVSEATARDLPAGVPLLGEALRACGEMLVNVELKIPEGFGAADTRSLARATVAELASTGRTERVVVSSFDQPVLEEVRRADHRVALGWLLGLTADPESCLVQAAERRFGAIHPFVAQVSGDLVERAHAAGMAVRVWTVNAPADLRAMVAHGVDAVITDRLGEALALVRKGGGAAIAPVEAEWRDGSRFVNNERL